MTQQEFEAPQPGDPIARDGESLIYLVTSVKCRYTEVIVHTVRVIHTKAFEQWERVEDNAGISFLPTDSDKLPDFNLLPIALNEQGNPKLNKHGNPIHEWTRFQREIPSAQWIHKWPNAWGIAIIGGKVSGNLYCMDFEAKDHKHGPMESIYPEWEKLVKAELIRLGYPDLFGQFPITKTMNGGIHIRWRVLGDKKLKNDKLAFAWSGDTQDGKPIANCLIEAKAEGGYALCPPSPGYEMVQGDNTQPPAVPFDLHETLVSIGVSFHSAMAIPDEPAHRSRKDVASVWGILRKGGEE